MNATPKDPQDSLSSRCRACRAPMVISARSCDACGQASVPPDAEAAALRLTRRLSERWAHAPYFRSAEGISYTPRRQLRGFLEGPRHPLNDALLAHLFQLALLVESGELRRLLHRTRAEFPSDAGRLAQAVHHIFEVHQDAWASVARLDNRDELREQLLQETKEPMDETVETAYRGWRSSRISAGE